MLENSVITQNKTLINDAINTAFFDVLKPFKKVFFITDDATMKASNQYVQQCLNHIEKTDVSIVIHSDLSFPYRESSLLEAAQTLKDFSCEVMIAYGDDAFIESIKHLSIRLMYDMGNDQHIPVIYIPKTIVFKSAFQPTVLLQDMQGEKQTSYTIKPDGLPIVLLDDNLIATSDMHLRYAALYLFAYVFECAVTLKRHSALIDFFKLVFTLITEGKTSLKKTEILIELDRVNRYLDNHNLESLPLIALEQRFRSHAIDMPVGLIFTRLLVPYFQMLFNNEVAIETLSTLTVLYQDDVIGFSEKVQSERFLERFKETIDTVFEHSEPLHKFDIDNTQISDYIHEVIMHIPSLRAYQEDDIYQLFETMLNDT